MNDRLSTGAQIAITLIVIGMLIMFSVAIMNFYNTQKLESQYQSVKTSYEVYLEGRKVVPDTFDISEYNIKIDDNLKRVYLTKRPRYAPVVVPVIR